MSHKGKQDFSISDRIKSFRYAFRGLQVLWETEHNVRIHLLAFILVILAGFFFNIAIWEWLIVFIVSFIVFITELLNTSLEYMADKVSPELDKLIGMSKDLSAAAVLLAALLAVICGIIIFLPHLLALI